MALVEVWCELVCENCKAVVVGKYVFGKYLPRNGLIKAAQRGGAAVRGEHAYCTKCVRDGIVEEIDGR